VTVLYPVLIGGAPEVSALMGLRTDEIQTLASDKVGIEALWRRDGIYHAPQLRSSVSFPPTTGSRPVGRCGNEPPNVWCPRRIL